MYKFKKDDRFTLVNDHSKTGTIIRVAKIDEFGTDLATYMYNYYVIEMDNDEYGPIHTDSGDIAEEKDMIKIVDDA